MSLREYQRIYLGNVEIAAVHQEDIRIFGEGVSAQTVPAAFAVDGWSVTMGSSTAEIVVTLTALPYNGGAAIETVEYTLDGGTVWTALSGAAPGAYPLVMAEAGASYVVSLRAVNAIGAGQASATLTAISAAEVVAAPANTALPAIIGAATVGETLTGSEGTWTGTPTLVLQWLRDGTAIPGATNTTYVLSEDDQNTTISLRVSATNAGGSAVAVSAGVGPVAAVPTTPEYSEPGYVLWTAAGASATSGAIASVAAVGEQDIALINTTSTAQPTRSGNLITWDGSDDILKPAAGPAARTTYHLLPDASGTETGKGFTCTGLARLPDGQWAIANHANNKNGDTRTVNPTLCILSSDFSTLVQEINITTDLTGVTSAQGVALDADGNIWVAIQGANVVRKFSAVGTLLKTLTLDYNPNAVGWDSITGRLIVANHSTKALNWYDLSTDTIVKTVSIYTTDTTLRPSDLIWFDKDFGTQGGLWMSYDEGGVTEGSGTGVIRIYDIASDKWSFAAKLTGANAIEGLWYERETRTLYVTNDAWFHGQKTPGNRVDEYKLLPPVAPQFSFFMSGTIGTPATSKTRCIIAMGEGGGGSAAADVAQLGLYVTQAGTLRIIVNESGTQVSSTDLTITGGLSTDGDYWIDVDLFGQTVTAYRDGVSVGSGTFATAPERFPAFGNLPTVGGAVYYEAYSSNAIGTVSRATPMSLRAWGYGCKAGLRSAVEALYP